MRFSFLALLVLFMAACQRPPTTPDPPVVVAPTGTILTVILEVRPPSDSLHVYRILRGKGRLRQDYPTELTSTPPADHLVFTFRDEAERVLRQTSLPYPGPNEYEVPREDGTLRRVTLAGETRTLTLRTQDRGRLKWLDIRGKTDKGREINRRLDLRQ